MKIEKFKDLLFKVIDNKKNPYHPLVWINGKPKIGKGTYIGGFSEVNAKGATILIGKNCDIASFVSINVADTHNRCIGKKKNKDVMNIKIGDNVFIGSHSVILGGAKIGHHSVVAAGTVVRSQNIPPYSLIIGNPCVVKRKYYKLKK